MLAAGGSFNPSQCCSLAAGISRTGPRHAWPPQKQQSCTLRDRLEPAASGAALQGRAAWNPGHPPAVQPCCPRQKLPGPAAEPHVSDARWPPCGWGLPEHHQMHRPPAYRPQGCCWGLHRHSQEDEQEIVLFVPRLFSFSFHPFFTLQAFFFFLST